MSAPALHAQNGGRLERLRANEPRVIRLTDIDGDPIPNLALMKLAHYHRSRGDEVVLRRNVQRDFWEPDYDVVYGSSIFTASRGRVAHFQTQFPGAIVGGTGLAGEDGWERTIEDVIGTASDYPYTDHTLYPSELRSIGLTQRVCRYRCAHCIVPHKEGRVRSIGPLHSIWRGDPYPKHILLLDNDFFGHPKPTWEAILAEARDGGFRIAFSQGINVRAITPAIAKAIASVDYYDNKFSTRRIYTAWDNVNDQRIFTRGIRHLIDAGVRADDIMSYMLVGFDPDETWDRILYRFNVMVELGIRVFPMPYRQLSHLSDPPNSLDYWRLKQFQRYANTGVYKFEPFDRYDANTKGSMAERRRYREIALSLFEPNSY